MESLATVSALVRFHGSICAIVTPFAGQAFGAGVDGEAYDRLVDWHLESGSNGIVVGGSTGESGSLDAAELDDLVARTVARAGGKMPVIAGCGSPATHKALAMVKRAQALGADAALVVTPFYVRPTQEGLYRHYSTLADEGGLPIILYNVPGRTGCDLLPETVARLAPHPMIAGVKEARPEPERMADLVALKRTDFAILSGDDPTAFRAICAGADGVISVAANVVPAEFAAMCLVAGDGDRDTAESLNAELEPLYAVLGAEPNPIPVKWLLAEMGRIPHALRLPLLSLSPAHHDAARACLDALRARELQHSKTRSLLEAL